MSWRNIPDEPLPTCPDINAAISHMEDVRKANEQLRDCVAYWKERAEEAEAEVEELEKKIIQLEDEMSAY